MGDTYSMSLNDLVALIGTADAPIIVDVCLDEDHVLDPRVIPAARRMGFEAAAKMEAEGPCVIACQKGKKLSQGVAAALRARGVEARYVEGGMVACADAGLALLPSGLDPMIGRHGCTWAVPSTPSAQDIIAAWVTKRFCDPFAVWWSVERDQVDLVADRFGIGTLALAGKIATQPGPHAERFDHLSQIADTDVVSKMLRTHGSVGSGGVDAIFPALDALWAMTGKVHA